MRNTQRNFSKVIPLYWKKPATAIGAAQRIHTQLAVSCPMTEPKSRYTPAAIPTARAAQTNCRMDRPKKMVSLCWRTSFGILTSILIHLVKNGKGEEGPRLSVTLKMCLMVRHISLCAISSHAWVKKGDQSTPMAAKISLAKATSSPPKKQRNPCVLWLASWDWVLMPIWTMPQPRTITPTARRQLKM